jgi:phospholipase/carboxylesterase
MATLTQLNGPRLPAQGGPAERLVILLHGYGSDGNDLIGLAPYWQRVLPRTAFVSPNAPERCESGGPGFQWFGLASRSEDARLNGVRKAAPLIDAFIDQELARQKLTDDRLALVGFSQGTMMALQVGLRRKRPPAAILGFSGMLVGADKLKAEMPPEPTPRPPVLLVHGDMDDMLPVQMLFEATQGLGAAGVPCEWHISHGVGHSIDEAGLSLGGQFLATSFRRRGA